MEPTPQLPHDIESLKALVVSHLRRIAHQVETIAPLEHNSQILTKLMAAHTRVKKKSRRSGLANIRRWSER